MSDNLKVNPILPISAIKNHLQNFTRQSNKKIEDIERIQKMTEQNLNEPDTINVRSYEEILKEQYHKALSKNTEEELDDAYFAYNLVILMLKKTDEKTKLNHIKALEKAYKELKN